MIGTSGSKGTAEQTGNLARWFDYPFSGCVPQLHARNLPRQPADRPVLADLRGIKGTPMRPPEPLPQQGRAFAGEIWEW